MRNKQKAWRLGAIVMGRRARAVKASATVIGSIFREFPGKLKATHVKRELLEVKAGRRELCIWTRCLKAPVSGYSAPNWGHSRWSRFTPVNVSYDAFYPLDVVGIEGGVVKVATS